MTARRTRSVGAAVGVLALALGADARAESPQPASGAVSSSEGPRLEWRAPADCPARDEVLAQVAALGESDRLRWDRFDVIRATVERRGSQWSLSLEFVAPGGVRTRTLQSGRCADLAEAAAVAIVLAHRSRAGEAGDGGEDTTEAGATGPATTVVDVTAPPSVVAPVAAQAAVGDVGGGAANTAHTSDATKLGLVVSAEAALDPTTLGSAAFGGAVGIELRLGAFATALYGVGFPSAATRLGPGQSITFGLWASGLRGCYRWARGFDTCGLVELGQITAQGVGLAQPRASRDLWVAPGLNVGFTSTPFDGFDLTTRVSVFHPLVRGQYRIDEGDVVHRVPAVGFRATVGIDLSLL